ncbi:MAG TPA: sigma-70 family RNA polymerase sigma factor [Bacteroidia bacterium]|nr:sigma-70 family RNA polymerase sigma factor [Bacteroidia bacterium]
MSSDRPELRRDALEDLCKTYWPPVYAFIRSKGVPRAEAEDLTQGFFAEFLSREDFAKADGAKGRLRTYLLRAVSNYMARDWRDRARQKRGGGADLLSLDVVGKDGRGLSIEPEDGATPEKAYQKKWAMFVIHQASEGLREKYVEKGQGVLFEELQFVIASGGTSERYVDIARRLNMSESAIKVAVHRLRGRFMRKMREIIADTVATEEDVEDEIRELMRAFG